MRDFSAAVQDFDEIWRTLFSQGLITPAARRNPGGVSVSDVSVAEFEDEDAYIAATTERPFFTLEQVMKESNCWCCRGFGHTRTTCPSTDATRSVGHAIQALSSINERKTKGGGKGKGKAAHAGPWWWWRSRRTTTEQTSRRKRQRNYCYIPRRRPYLDHGWSICRFHTSNLRE